MKRNFAPGVPDIIFCVIAPLTAITRTVKLTHSDGDLAAHIRMGDVIRTTGAIPGHSLSSFTASNEPMVAHAWLSEIIFSLLHAAGGLALISAVTGILVGFTHASVAMFLRKRGVDARWALAAGLISLAVSSTHWLARPHMFSILGVALTLYLLESRSKKSALLTVPLFLLWTNLHGGWLFGLVMIACYAIGDSIEAVISPERREEWATRAQMHGAAFGLAAVSTLVNPFGIELHREVISGATSSDLAKQMGEFMPPNFQSLAALPFVLALLLSIALIISVRKRMSIPQILVTIVSLAFALRSFRGMAIFGVSAWPLIALHASNAWPAGRRAFPMFNEIARLDASTRAGIYALPVAIALLVIGANNGRVFGTRLIRTEFKGTIFPVAAVERIREAGFTDRIFELWSWGGYIMYASHDAQLLVDPLKFNSSTVNAYSQIDAVRPGWQGELERWNIRTIVVPPKSRLAQALEREPRWTLWYRDSTSSVFRPAGN